MKRLLAPTLVCSFFILFVMGSAADEKAPAPDQVKVLVAKKRLGPQTLLNSPQELFDVRSVPVNKAPKNYFQADKLATLQGRLVWGIGKGDVLRAEHLFPEDIESLEDIVEPRYRAMAIKVSPDTAAGGLILPGSHVDVLHAVSGVSTVLLENVRVLAVNDNWQRRPSGKPVGGKIKTVTLELFNVDQTLKLTAACERGSIRLSLRNPRDDGREPPQKPVPPPPPPIFDPR